MLFKVNMEQQLAQNPQREGEREGREREPAPVVGRLGGPDDRGKDADQVHRRNTIVRWPL